MAGLENIVTRLRIIVLCYSYSAYNQNDTLELLSWNCQRWTIYKTLSHAFESSFSATLMVLTIRTTLWNSYREIVA